VFRIQPEAEILSTAPPDVDAGEAATEEPPLSLEAFLAEIETRARRSGPGAE